METRATSLAPGRQGWMDGWMDGWTGGDPSVHPYGWMQKWLSLYPPGLHVAAWPCKGASPHRAVAVSGMSSLCNRPCVPSAHTTRRHSSQVSAQGAFQQLGARHQLAASARLRARTPRGASSSSRHLATSAVAMAKGAPSSVVQLRRRLAFGTRRGVSHAELTALP